MSSNNNKPVHPQPVLQTKITMMSDGSANVNNFPTNLLACLDLFFAAFKAVVMHFIEQAKAGNLDEKYTMIPKKILTKNKTLVGLDGKLVQ